jgi:hypothetical protein
VLRDEIYLADSIWNWTQLNWKWKYGYSIVAIAYLCCDFIFSSDFHLLWPDVFMYRWFHFTHLSPCLLLHTLFLFLVVHFILTQEIIARRTVFHTEPCARHWQMLECCDIFWHHLHAIGSASLGSIPNVAATQNQEDLNWWISFLSFIVVNANTQLIFNIAIAVFPKKNAIVSIHSLQCYNYIGKVRFLRKK